MFNVYLHIHKHEHKHKTRNAGQNGYSIALMASQTIFSLPFLEFFTKNCTNFCAMFYCTSCHLSNLLHVQLPEEQELSSISNALYTCTGSLYISHPPRNWTLQFFALFLSSQGNKANQTKQNKRKTQKQKQKKIAIIQTNKYTRP